MISVEDHFHWSGYIGDVCATYFNELKGWQRKLSSTGNIVKVFRLDISNWVAIIACASSLALGTLATWQGAKLIELERQSQQTTERLSILENAVSIQQAHYIIRGDVLIDMIDRAVQMDFEQMVSYPKLIQTSAMIEYIDQINSSSLIEKTESYATFLSLQNTSNASAKNLVVRDTIGQEHIVGSLTPGERRLILVSSEELNPYSKSVYLDPDAFDFEYEAGGTKHHVSAEYIPPATRAWLPSIGETPRFGSSSIEDPNSPLLED